MTKHLCNLLHLKLKMIPQQENERVAWFKTNYLHKGPAIAMLEYECHEFKTTISAAKHELIFTLEQIQPSCQYSQGFNRWNKQRPQTRTPQVTRQGPLETKPCTRLHPPKIEQSNDPTHS